MVGCCISGSSDIVGAPVHLVLGYRVGATEGWKLGQNEGVLDGM